MSLDVYLIDSAGQQVYSSNITHNLGGMAREAGIYKHLWRPDEIGAAKASDIADAVEAGLIDMVRRPTHYKQFDSENGWGRYVHFVPWVAEYLEALRANPDATLEICR